MRLMLGRNNEPLLLVEVADDRDPHNFDFYVVNGDWRGNYNHGIVSFGDTVLRSDVKILCHEQDRLQGDYNTVFENYDNVKNKLAS